MVENELEFDWDDENNDSVVIKPRHGIAVYETVTGAIAIRVQNNDVEDDIVCFEKHEALKIIPAIHKIIQNG